MLPRLRGQTSVGGDVDGGLAVLPLLAAIILSSQVRHLSAIGRTEGEGVEGEGSDCRTCLAGSRAGAVRVVISCVGASLWTLRT